MSEVASKPRINESAVRAMLRRECGAAGGQSAWADLHGISNSYVNDIVMGRRPISKLIAKRLGLKRVILFEALDT